MIPILNQDIVGAIVQADSEGANRGYMKNLYILRNALNLNLDSPIYRIVELEYLFGDLREKCLSHTKIDKLNWGDTNENPLLGREFTDVVTGGVLTLDALVCSVYGCCWTAIPMNSLCEWAIFSRRKPSVRLQSTPRKLLNAVMDVNNPSYMHQHIIGKMEYATDVEIEKYFSDPNWEKYLDGIGQGIALSFLRLNESLSDENEVRLMYDHLVEGWAQSNVRIVGNHAKVPFNWVGVVDNILVGPFVKPGDEEASLKLLAGFGFYGPVSKSGVKVTAVEFGPNL